MNLKFPDFYIMPRQQIKQLEEQEEAFVKLTTILNENMDKYKKLPKSQLDIIRKHVMQGYDSDYAFNKSEIYNRRLKRLNQETVLSYDEAEYICNLFEDKRYMDIITYYASNPYLSNIIQEIMEDDNEMR